MIDSIRGYRQTQAILPEIKMPSSKSSTVQSQSSPRDTVFISEEARRLLEESKMQNASADTGNTLTAEATEKSLFEQFQDYIKNPTLAHALDKMKDAVQSLGLSENATKEVYDRVVQAFRSGVPEKGKQTTDTLDNLAKELKKTGMLSDDQLNDLMADISNIVSWAQEEGDADDPLKDNADKHALS